MRRVKLTVYGDVQGVFYRSETQNRAECLGLTGYVRNTKDGAVEVVAEGNDNLIEKLIEFCRLGSRAAKVKDVKVEEQEYKGEFTEFEIRY